MLLEALPLKKRGAGEEQGDEQGDSSKNGWKNRLGEQPGEAQRKWSGQKALEWGLPAIPSTHPTNQARQQARQELGRCVLCLLYHTQNTGASLSVAAAPQAQSMGHPVLRKGGWWPASLSEPQKPPEPAYQIACLDPGIHIGEVSMMAWHGTASPTKWETQSAGSGPSSQISHLQRAHRPQSPSSPPGLLGERRASSRAQWPKWDCLPASKQCQEHSAPSGQSR